MLFLLNDQVIDLGDPGTTISEKLSKLTPLPAAQITGQVAIQLGKALYFACQAGQRPNSDAQEALAALLLDRTEANALLIVRPPNANSLAEVQTRLANVDLPVLAHLHELQKRAPLTPALVNNCVWAQAA
jgi:hypothetical protein